MAACFSGAFFAVFGLSTGWVIEVLASGLSLEATVRSRKAGFFGAGRGSVLATTVPPPPSGPPVPPPPPPPMKLTYWTRPFGAEREKDGETTMRTTRPTWSTADAATARLNAFGRATRAGVIASCL